VPNTRTIQIPHDHLVAELVAFPFVSRSSLEIGLTALDPELKKGSTSDLWRQTEQYFVSHFPHVSLDELVSTRNLTWFGKSSRAIRPIRMENYLRQTAADWLEPRGPVAVPKLPDGPTLGNSREKAARLAWRWLTFAMPGDLLLAGLTNGDHTPNQVKVISPVVETLLREGGYPETHLHAGAALDFPTGWAAGMNCVARDMSHDQFRSPGADHCEGDDLGGWVMRSAIVRYLLGEFLSREQNANTKLTRFFANRAGSVRRVSKLHCDAIGLAIQDLSNGSLTSASDQGIFAGLQNAYNWLTKASTFATPKRLDEVQKLDPLSRLRGFKAYGHDGPSVQLQFLRSGLCYLENNSDDLFFAKLFWQVERVRCQVYRHCIQRPLTPGLMNFIRYYDRKSAITDLLEPVECESAGVLGGVGDGLRSLEVRTSPKSNFQKQLADLKQMRDQFRTLARQSASSTCECESRCKCKKNSDHNEGVSRGWAELEYGLVLHFLKFRGDPSDEGVPKACDRGNHADPRLGGNTNLYRWQDYWNGRERSARAIVGAIQRAPDLLHFLRGIDVCRDEHGVPTWVVAPLFKLVREQVENISAEVLQHNGILLPPLRTTAHVGEDFVHLASGLRYMDEAVRYLPLRNGDRIGHGLALGVEPKEWATKSHRLPMPREDRWFDLIWERSWHSHAGARFSPDRKAFVEEEISRLGHEIFRTRHEWTVAGAKAFVKFLHSRSVLNRLGFPRGMLSRVPPRWQDVPNWLPEHLELYLYSSQVYARSREVQWVYVDSEAPVLTELQRLLRQRYAETGITIEVNPISNLLVGDLSDLESHPLWRLAPGLGHKLGSVLQICVGSDDPFPFATTLPEEYQFLYDALLTAGRSHAEARIWLEDIRKISLESRFTVPQPRIVKP